MVSAKPIRRSPSYKGLRQGVIPLTSSGSYGSLASSPPPGRGGGGSSAGGGALASASSRCARALLYAAVCAGLVLAGFLLASPGGSGGTGSGLEQSIVASSLRTASAKRGLLLGGAFVRASSSSSFRGERELPQPHPDSPPCAPKRRPLFAQRAPYWAIGHL